MYIDGDYKRAEDRLRTLAESAGPDALRRTAYLYLGRTYMALGSYAEAADAFAAGVQMGGGVEFEAFLDEVRGQLGVSPAIIRAVAALTRGQLAALFTYYFGASRSEVPSAARNLPLEARAAVGAGVMQALPDGRFHGDRYISPAAMYVIAHRVAHWLGRSPAAVDARFFPRGFDGEISDRETSRWISGRVAVDILEALSAAPVGVGE